ncbi:DUF4291 domain-containing protein [Aspergillus fischeri NRRL 181]|uniref:DUF4291 domain-containing protein n=1 Tax=Neosartorya fischeri (strain ATCC 1020 / DSM 3700 / CBS 544.65 / FGSC A1164 / JCM 1740 / NRRL 181 / WB 181) TaxID=331117 RepID=A1CYE3_NEOFI|nr:conserved hypothetical protein [Aspergillus fischeri NRRL 181]EAW23763.1 conserved hypothetical protein [Aspergillus fischeri NRRL 181]
MARHPSRQIRAKYTSTTITIYQAYSPSIADAAVDAQKFVPPFSRTRMTWIKPSFLWMAYRSGWARKPNQERVLAIEITRKGFEWALQHSCLSHCPGQDAEEKAKWQKRLQNSPVRVQWDPERDFQFRPLDYRSIQIGLSADAADKYVDEWIVGIADVTEAMRQIEKCLAEGRTEDAARLMPAEEVYPLSEELKDILEAT